MIDKSFDLPKSHIPLLQNVLQKQESLNSKVRTPSINGERTESDYNLLLVADACFPIKPTAGPHSQCGS